MDELPLLFESVHASNNAERNRQKCGKPLSRTSPKSKKKRWNPIDARALQRPGDPGDTSLCFRLEPLDSQRKLQARTESASSCASFHLSEPLPRAISTPCARWTKDSTQDFAGLALAENFRTMRCKENSALQKCQWPDHLEGNAKVLDLQIHVRLWISACPTLTWPVSSYFYMQWQACNRTREALHIPTSGCNSRPNHICSKVAVNLTIDFSTSPQTARKNTKVSPLLSFGKVTNDLGKAKRGMWDTYQQVVLSCKHLGELYWSSLNVLNPSDQSSSKSCEMQNGMDRMYTT